MTDVSGKNAAEISSMLREISVDEIIEVEVLRSDTLQTVSVTCRNFRPIGEKLLAALDMAASGKFAECATALAQREELGSYGALLTLQCTSATKRPDPKKVAQLKSNLFSKQIEDAFWEQTLREDLARTIHRNKSDITMHL